MLNVSKTQPIILGSGSYVNALNHLHPPKIVINDIEIPYCDNVCNLGVTSDPTLSWYRHSNIVINKIFANVAQLRRNYSFMPKTVRKMIVNSLLLPILDYGSTVFTDIPVTVNVKLQRAQNACIRFVCGAAKFDHVTQLYRELRWLKLEDRRKLNIALFTLRVFKSSAPLYILKEFTSVSSVKSRSTRSNQNSLVVPHHRTAKYSHSFLVTATNIWNEYSLFDYIHLVSTSRLKCSILEKLLSKY